MIAKRIRELRISNDLTQKDLAVYLGLTPKMISFYELGQRVPPIDILLKLAFKFDVSTDYLLGRDQFEKKEISLSPEKERLIKEIQQASDDDLKEMEYILKYLKSKKEKNEDAATIV